MKGNVYKITVGTISNDWDLEFNSGLVYATDGDTLGPNAEVIAMCKIQTGDGAIFIANGETHSFDDLDDFFEFADGFSLPGFSEDQNRALRGILYVDDDADYDLNPNEWEYTLGDMGEVRLTNEAYKKAMVVNVTPWYDTKFKLDEEDSYGVSIDGDAADRHEFCGVFKKS